MFDFVLTTPERLADNRPITSVKGAIKGVWCCHKLRINSFVLRLKKKREKFALWHVYLRAGVHNSSLFFL